MRHSQKNVGNIILILLSRMKWSKRDKGERDKSIFMRVCAHTRQTMCDIIYWYFKKNVIVLLRDIVFMRDKTREMAVKFFPSALAGSSNFFVTAVLFNQTKFSFYFVASKTF